MGSLQHQRARARIDWVAPALDSGQPWVAGAFWVQDPEMVALSGRFLHFSRPEGPIAPRKTGRNRKKDCRAVEPGGRAVEPGGRTVKPGWRTVKPGWRTVKTGRLTARAGGLTVKKARLSVEPRKFRQKPRFGRFVRYGVTNGPQRPPRQYAQGRHAGVKRGGITGKKECPSTKIRHLASGPSPKEGPSLQKTEWAVPNT
jgi:hypothetical protein